VCRLAPDCLSAVQRRVSCRGSIQVAGQRIQVGIGHADTTVDVHTTDATWRIHLDDELLLEVPRTSGKPVARSKVRKPEPPRRPIKPKYLPVRQSTATRNS